MLILVYDANQRPAEQQGEPADRGDPGALDHPRPQLRDETEALEQAAEDGQQLTVVLDWGAERQAFTGELRGLLEWAIDTLPNGMREVFVLREVEELSTSEVAECLGVSEDVVKTRLSRGRATLRRLLMERTGATAPEAFRFYRPRCDRVVAKVLERVSGQSPSAARRVTDHLASPSHSGHRFWTYSTQPSRSSGVVTMTEPVAASKSSADIGVPVKNMRRTIGCGASLAR